MVAVVKDRGPGRLARLRDDNAAARYLQRRGRGCARAGTALESGANGRGRAPNWRGSLECEHEGPGAETASER